MSTDPIYGATGCQAVVKSTGKNCTNKAYFKTSGGYFCGVHSKGVQREELQKDSKGLEEQKKQDNLDRQRVIEEARKTNKIGKVMVSKFEMRKAPQYAPGYLAVFPNRDHENRSDGLGISALSPMVLGPVNHVMKNLPPAKNLENYYQFAKISEESTTESRIQGYLNPEGQRHGSHGKGAKIFYSVYYSPNGEARKYNYIQSRFFYCHYYEKLSVREIEKLKKVINDGYNIQIFGFDGHEIEKPLMEYYEDENLPFGHEIVIYCLLTINDPEEYPWNIYRKKHPELYVDMV